MRPPVVLASLAIPFVLVPTLASAEPNSAVTVRITDRGCTVSRRTIPAGEAAFRIDNRGRRVARFEIAGRRSASVRPRRRATLGVTLAPGPHRYRCRPRGSGTLIAIAIGPPSEHRIAVRVSNGVGELYDRATGQTFVPRGNNYVRIGAQISPVGFRIVYHTTFNLDHYDAAGAEVALQRMQVGGYNTVRVFLNGACTRFCLGDAVSRGLSSRYVANVADFLRRAKAHGILVVLTTDGLPSSTRYEELMGSGASATVGGLNVDFLTEQGIEANAQFWRDLVSALIATGAPLDALLAYELRNEAFFLASEPPFSLSTGSLRAPNGTTYDLSSPTDRRRLLEDSFVLWIDRMRTAIRDVDPTALVTIGFFHDTEPNPARRGDNRLVRTRAVIERSSADFIDIHPYADDELTFPQFMQNYGIDGPVAKPIIIGEFGASKRAYLSASQAAEALVSWQRQACAYGIDGWLLWTWDTDEQPDLWNGLSSGGAIARALAPATRPDPCAPGTGRRRTDW